MTGEEVLRVESLRLSFRGGRPGFRDVQAVKGVSLQIRAGETLALVGESGSGKTALVRQILKLHSSHISEASGSIRLLGREVLDLPEEEMRKLRGAEAGMVFQDPASSLDSSCRIGDQIAETVLLHQEVSKEEAYARAEELLAQMGIDDTPVRMRQYPQEFSGGMLQRAAIACALACGPRLLIADEPTTALDRDSQQLVIDLMKRLAADRDRGILFVSHDLSIVREIADRICVMKEGHIIEEGTPEEIFQAPREEYTKKLVLYSRYGKGSVHHHGKTGDDGGGFRNKIIVHIDGLNKSYEKGRRRAAVLKDFSLDIREGEVVGLAGPSGIGKSTLARLIVGLEKADSGILQVSPGLKTSMIFQDSSQAFDPRLRILDIIGEPLRIRGVPGPETRSRVRETMDRVFLPMDLAERFPHELSGGERQRAAIARALITRPDFLIADEPIASLDVSIQAQIIHLLREIHDERGMTMMIISHDLPMIAHVADRIVRLGRQEIR